MDPLVDTLTASKAVYDAVMDQLPNRFNRVLQTYGIEADSKTAAISKEWESRFASLQEHFEKRLQEQATDYQQRLDNLHKSYIDGISAVFKSMPIPQVIFPEHAIQVDVKQDPPQIQVNVPEMKPVINMEVPKKTTTTKSIVYEGNRPSRIIEETENS